ncbi:MAG: epoxyqueuosine reductase QueH [Chloroflexota bacterium]|nr:epoxyqueuosine reductase QueH [Chloroflexota bacterium]
MTNILLHACCAPCALYCVNRLRDEGFDVGTFWYNPNIHPFVEHRLRLQSMQTLSQKMAFPLTVADGYDMIDYFRGVVGNEGARCGHCFRMRMEKTAQVAKENGFDAFTTTLFISPYQKHDLLRDICEAISREYKVDFHYEDFRPGFREGHKLSREMELYHQKYCGCVYSEWERFGKVDIEKMMGGG